MPFTNLGERKLGELNDREFAWYDMSGGLNIKSTPQQVADNELTQAINVYLRNDGGIESRRGTTLKGTSLGSVGVTGLAYFEQKVKNGAPITPKQYLLAQCGANLFDGNTSTQIGTNALGVGAAPMTWDVAYDPAHTGGASDIIIMCTGVAGPYAYDGTSAYTLPTNVSCAGASLVKVVNNITWFAGFASQPNLVIGSALGAPETEPVYQEFTVSHPVTALGMLGAGAQAALVVGMERGLSIISGVGPSNFTMQEVPSEDGVAAPRAMMTIDGVVYYLGGFAIYRFDGTVPQIISRKVEPWVLNDPLYRDFPMQNKSSAHMLYWNNKLYVFYDAGNVGYPTCALVYDLVLNGWTVYSGQNVGAAVLYGDADDASGFTAFIGSPTTGQLYNFDVLDANGKASDNGVAFTSLVASKFFKLGMPGARKTLRRLYFEIFSGALQATGGALTDYGASSSSGVVTVGQTAAGTWDVSSWDAAAFAGGPLTYSNVRVDLNLIGEAFSFTFANQAISPPFQWMGCTGVYAQKARN